jgi:ABC-2 type transport system ATP-binding protein
MAVIDLEPRHAALRVRDLVAGYGGAPVLDGVSLRLEAGELLAVLGGNGAGKSTLLKVLLGMLAPTSGTAAVFGVSPQADPVAARAKLAYVPENVAVYPHLSGVENLRYLLGLADRRPDDAALAAALREVDLPEAAWRARSASYSKGMRQKLLIALALLREAPLLLLDEPASGLDPEATDQLAALLARLRDAGKAILMVSHDLEATSAIADRYLFLAKGRVLREGIDLAALGADASALRSLYARRADLAP